MCGRFALAATGEEVAIQFELPIVPFIVPRYNIAPTQPVLIVRYSMRLERELVLVRWGLIPSWVKDPQSFSTLINARSETAREKPSFRASMRHRRCLVPTDGFYEWTGEKGAKQPHLIRPKNGGLMAMAGIFDHWLGADGSELETMAILTTRANRTMQSIHDRMPVILSEEDFDAWLDCRSGTADFVADMMRPAADNLLEVVPVSRALNNPRNEGPEVQQMSTTD